MLLRHCYSELEKVRDEKAMERLRELSQMMKEEAIKLDQYTREEQIRNYESIFRQLKKMFNIYSVHYSAAVRQSHEL